ncbi:MAG: tRNA 2-thiouridine(34) synthase MnmA [Planctomycetes bacterium GWF2_50_10]|nr:MAG: tRNA 2-thiouridine(34) synthase MnmA [Planctomycetes bacterium GWF2_50_10]
MSQTKILVGVSGGVDSSTTAALMLKEGYHVEGMFMITHDHAAAAETDARKITEQLGIKLHVLDVRKDFERIICYFTSEYKIGRTPNPCVYCNRNVKFAKLMELSEKIGTDFIATGHYAQVLKKEDGWGLYAAGYLPKDQSYALAMLEKRVLEKLVLPLGLYKKPDVRLMAAEMGLHVEAKPDSQEICFIPDNEYAAMLERLCPELVREGNIIDSGGKVIGTHRGIHNFTIGQRRGLGVAKGEPVYVTKIDADSNTVTLGPRAELMRDRLFARGVNWLIDKPKAAFPAKIKIRYNNAGHLGEVRPVEGGCEVVFNEPVAAITAGQAAVFYVEQYGNSRVVGGGWIE